jgi:hypothetical protein
VSLSPNDELREEIVAVSLSPILLPKKARALWVVRVAFPHIASKEGQLCRNSLTMRTFTDT